MYLPAVPASVTLDRFRTRTTVTRGIDAAEDAIWLNGQGADGKTRQRVSAFLDLVAPSRPRCKVVSDNNFPTAAGLRAPRLPLPPSPPQPTQRPGPGATSTP